MSTSLHFLGLIPGEGRCVKGDASHLRPWGLASEVAPTPVWVCRMLLDSDLGRTAWLSQGGTGLACSRGALLGPDTDSTWRAADTERGRPGNEPRCWLGHWLQEGHHHKGSHLRSQSNFTGSTEPARAKDGGEGRGERWPVGSWPF